MYAKTVALVTSALSVITAAAIFGIMTVSFGDVTARTFARPIGGAYEITVMLVGLMVFAALPIVTYNGKHVAVSLLHSVFKRSPLLNLAVDIFSRAVIMATCLFLGYHLWQLGSQFSARNARAVFAGLPMAPFAYFAAIMCILSALAAIIRPNTAPVGEEI